MTLYVLLKFSTTPWNTCYYSHFTDGKIKSREVKWLKPRSHSYEAEGLRWYLSSLVPEPMCFITVLKISWRMALETDEEV